MSQGAASPENSLCLEDKLLWPTLREAYAKEEDGRGSGDKLAQHSKDVRGIAASETSLIRQKTLEDNVKEYVRRDAILKMLHKKKYKIDFHGYTCFEAIEELKDIIISLKYNMKGKSKQQFTVITGKGNHSLHGIPLIKDAIWNYLKKKHIEFEPEENNSGRTNITVYKAGGTQDHC